VNLCFCAQHQIKKRVASRSDASFPVGITSGTCVAISPEVTNITNNNSASDHLQRAHSRKKRLGRKLTEFFISIPWGDWWEEFNLSVDHNGMLRYKTARQFAKAKGRNSAEIELIAYCIGPQPQTLRKHLPWCGDWQQGRCRELCSLDATDATAIAEPAKPFESQLEKLGKAAPFAFRDLLRLDRLAAKIDEAFAGQPILADKPLDGEENKRRLDLYFSLHERLLRLKHRATTAWIRTLGARMKDMEPWFNMAVEMAASGSLNDAVRGGTTTANGESVPVVSDQVLGEVTVQDIQLAKNFREAAWRAGTEPKWLATLTPTDMLLAWSISAKAKLYNMPHGHEGSMRAVEEEANRRRQTGKENAEVAAEQGLGLGDLEHDV
jgi:hypothetical protein